MASNRQPTPPSPPTQRQRIVDFFSAHPTLGTFLLMAPTMVVILQLSIQNVPLEPTQRLAMIAMTVALAGACAWILGWESESPS